MPVDLTIDLHAHSNASDGTETPAAVMAAAVAAGLDVIALTDHDTTDGWAEAVEAARRCGLTLVRGTEVSAKADGISVHLLSYLHDPDHPALAEQNAIVKVSRATRAQEMVTRLGVDYSVTWDDVLAQTEPGTTIGRPHIADALVMAGYAPDRSSAFASILRPGTPYYVHQHVPDAVTAIRAIVASGGVPVFAHPGAEGRGRIVSDQIVEEMVEAGLAGLEVNHRDNSPEQRRRLTALADALGLFVTGASDYHGSGKPNRLGENTTDPEVFDRIEQGGHSDVIRP